MTTGSVRRAVLAASLLASAVLPGGLTGVASAGPQAVAPKPVAPVSAHRPAVDPLVQPESSGDAALAPRTPGRRACNRDVYVSNSGSNTVSVVQPDGPGVVATITVGNRPINPVFTPDGRHVYVSSPPDGTLTVIDTARRAVRSSIPVGPRPEALAFTPDGRELVITYHGDSDTSPGHVRIMDVATRTLSGPIPVGIVPDRIAMSPDGSHVYVPSLLSSTVSVINVSRRAHVADIPIPGGGPFNVRVSRDGAKVYVGNTLAGGISVIDTTLNLVTFTLAGAPSPNGMDFAADATSLFVSNVLHGLLQEIDLATGTPRRTVDLGRSRLTPSWLEVSADGSLLYLLLPFDDQLAVFDTATLSELRTIKVGAGPTVIEQAPGQCRP